MSHYTVCSKETPTPTAARRHPPCGRPHPPAALPCMLVLVGRCPADCLAPAVDLPPPMLPRFPPLCPLLPRLSPSLAPACFVAAPLHCVPTPSVPNLAPQCLHCTLPHRGAAPLFQPFIAQGLHCASNVPQPRASPPDSPAPACPSVAQAQKHFNECSATR